MVVTAHRIAQMVHFSVAVLISAIAQFFLAGTTSSQ
jgi:hypothetical protein